MSEISLNVNGSMHRMGVADTDLLLDVLRRRLGVTSVREGCGVGACGACTVLADGASVSACLTRATRFDGAQVTTADGLDEDDPVVSAFVDSAAMQCGYCIPGFVLMAQELLDEQADPTDEQIREHLEGNICRCGTYPEILRAVRLAAERRRG